jgi:hypothetical protein
MVDVSVTRCSLCPCGDALRVRCASPGRAAIGVYATHHVRATHHPQQGPVVHDRKLVDAVVHHESKGVREIRIRTEGFEWHTRHDLADLRCRPCFLSQMLRVGASAPPAQQTWTKRLCARPGLPTKRLAEPWMSPSEHDALACGMSARTNDAADRAYLRSTTRAAHCTRSSAAGAGVVTNRDAAARHGFDRNESSRPGSASVVRMAARRRRNARVAPRPIGRERCEPILLRAVLERSLVTALAPGLRLTPAQCRGRTWVLPQRCS